MGKEKTSFGAFLLNLHHLDKEAKFLTSLLLFGEDTIFTSLRIFASLACEDGISASLQGHGMTVKCSEQQNARGPQ